ncbi:iron-containing alcohol dehydrogenase [Rothia sp. p3-SID1597]|uniref:iron-containing alcohol dehydrogenase n=1 Tax=Kocuria massiliensis TaxID=1926282 RepID=UPI0006615595|nr:iron-containing alcohol dehydrogenase [Kocuria massiliensis]MCT1368519.1 iron-containing alcohol dehydrogenase [Rothia sp. p3-SID1597]
MKGRERGVMLADAHLLDTNPHAQAIAERYPEVRLIGPESDLGETIHALRGDVLQGTLPISAMGGGVVMDHAKLACAVLNGNISIRALNSSARSPLLFAKAANERMRARVCLLPSTIGTGSHASTVAIHRSNSGRKKLIIGDSLKASTYETVPELFRSLPLRILSDGIREIFYRLVGPLTMERTELTPLESLVLQKVIAVALGEDPRNDLSSWLELSGKLHHRDNRSVTGSFGHRIWYLAHELSATTNTTKMQATDYLVPRLWARPNSESNRFIVPDALDNLNWRIRHAQKNLATGSNRIDVSGNPLLAIASCLGLGSSGWHPSKTDLRQACDLCRKRWGSLVAPGEEWSTEQLVDILVSQGQLWNIPKSATCRR